MFNVNQKVIYPAYGLSIVKRIETKTLAGKSKQFYVLQTVENGMTIMLPIDDVERIGMREIVSKEKARDILRFLVFGGIKVEAGTTWNVRYREYAEKLATGNIDETAQVMVALKILNQEKDLSFGERKMLDRARTLLESELIEVLGLEEYSECAI